MKNIISMGIKKFKRKLSARKKKKYLLTLGLISLFLLTDISSTITLDSKFEITSFTANTYLCDVHEEVSFTWKVSGNYSVAWILYGDGTREKFNNSIISTKHKYKIQGKFKVTLFIQYLGISGVEMISKSLPQLIEVKNEAPEFEISLSNPKPFEDEEVVISVPQLSLKESSHDKQPGVLTYIFNTGDSTEAGQITTNKSSITYKWQNAGTYPLSIYIFDDQGALTQKTKYVEVINKPPKAFYTIKSNPEEWFGIGKDLSKFISYSFEDGQIPSGWSHEPSYASIVPFNTGNNKVLKLHGKTNASVPLKAQGLTCDISPQTSGTLEFSFYKESGSAGFIFSFISENYYWDDIWTDNLLLRFDYNNSGNIEIKNDYLPAFHPHWTEYIWKPLTKMTTHAWYKVRIDYRWDNDDKYMGLPPGYVNVWINGEKLIANYRLRSMQSSFQYIHFNNWDYGEDITYIDEVSIYPEATLGYSEKSNIQFSAEGSLDTSSDADALSFIWDFGDNSTGFGKYISHSYLTSGSYDVTLYVKDDNGAIDKFSRTIYIHNQYPDVKLTVQDQKMVINEGETVIFNSQITDDSTDISGLSYLYDFNNPVFDPANLDNFEKGGSYQSHLFKDDYAGKAGVMVIDSENAYDFDFTDVIVNNVNPSINIWDACIMNNISLEVHRNEVNYNSNFTFEFRASNESVLTKIISFRENDELLVSCNKSLLSMSLKKDWKIVVNSSAILPKGSWFQAMIKFEFLNGKELTISSDKLYGGSLGYWEIDLNQYWYNKDEYMFLYPITMNASAWDPSVDDIEVYVFYDAEILLEINCSNSLPMHYNCYEEFGFPGYVNIFEQNDKIYARIDIFEIVKLTYYKNNSFPVNIDFSFNVFPFYDSLCENLIDFFKNAMNLLDFQIIGCLKAHYELQARVLDDDGGSSIQSCEIDMKNGMEFTPFSPRIIPIIPVNESVNNDVFFATVIYDLNLINITTSNSTLQISAKFGYNSLYQQFNNDFEILSKDYLLNYGNLTFTWEGEYLITIRAEDIDNDAKSGGVINILCPPTYGTIGNFPNTALQNKMVHFNSEFHAYGTNESTLIYMWSFGDGSFAFCRNPNHAWNKPGVYNITLLTVDCYGHISKDVAIITIQEQPLQICGPFTFHGIEGQAIILDVEIHDAFINELTLNYYWYDSNHILISRDKKPTVFLQAGFYCYTIIVKDWNNQTVEAEISVFIENAAPLVFTSNYMYNGAPGEELFLYAYGFDSFFDNGDLSYYWTIYNDDHNYSLPFINQGTSCSIKFLCERTFVYQGQVKIIDSSGNVGIATFSINSFIDTNGNGISDEFERQLLIFGEEITSYSDVDNDGLIDLFEMGVSKTSYTNPDTDNDGLMDGIDFTTGIGELTIGTDPLNYDSDGDMLSDGFEYFGWEFTSEIYGALNVSTNPLDIDTDLDKLSDNFEYLSGTDPCNPDSDGDLLVDGEDPFPLIIDGDRDGLTDYEEWKLGTDLNSSDSDNDGLTDGQEVKGWHFKTNPLSIDSDHDFLADSAEYKTYTCSAKWNENEEYIGDKRVELNKDIYLLFEERIESAITAEISFDISFGEFGSTGTMEYGIAHIPDLEIIIVKDDLILFNITSNRSRYISHAVDIRELMENSTMEYNGKYYLKINNTNAKCILETFQIEITTFLNPNNPDFDDDGILDGVETSLLVEGKNKIDFKEIYHNNSLRISEDIDAPNFNAFSLEIPQLGLVNKPKLAFTITSKDLLYGDGYVVIKLVKIEHNCSVDDIIIIETSRFFVHHYNFYYEVYLDLSEYFTKDQFYGTYELSITICDSNYTRDAFMLSEFYIEADTFIIANSTDTNAWITDPAQKDTDGDTLIDSYEIEKGWNPLSVDTDADGVWDNKDNDPFHDLIIEVELVSATGGNKLKAGVFYTQRNEKIGIWTPESEGTLNYKYYIDVNDARDYVNFNFQLYKMGYTYYIEKKVKKTFWEKVWDYIFGWIIEKFTEIIRIKLPITVPDTKLGSWNHKYEVGDSDDRTFRGARFNHDKTLRVKIKAIPLARTNTIAIFEKNSSFNGHYPQQERMGVLQLYVNEDANESPFQKGLNTIIIPTHLFTNTILNGKIQRQQLETTPLNECEFASIERDDHRTHEITSENVDFVIIQSELHATEAMEILDLVLTCIVNQSTNETAILHSFVSTKLNGTKAEQMNLPSEVLKLIPFFSNYKNSPQSSRPATFLETFVKNLVELTASIVKFIISLAEGITKVIQTIKKAIENIALAILSFIANLLYLLIRAALLILIYTLLALEILTMATIFTAVGLTFTTISSFTGLQMDYQVQWYADYGKDTRIGLLDLEVFNNDISVEGWILWDYWSFFDLYIPYSDMDFNLDINLIQQSIKPEEPTLHCGYSQMGPKNSTRFNFYTIYRDSNADNPNFVKLHLISPNKTEYEYLMIGNTNNYDDSSYLMGVEYNITIDFERMAPGQWFYYFTAKEDSEYEYSAKYPYDHYCEPGPYIDANRGPENPFPYLLYSYADDCLGYGIDEYCFTVVGADFVNNNIPNKVSLNVLWKNGTIQVFPMNIVDSYTFEAGYNSTVRNITLTTYQTTLNFSQYIDLEEMFVVRSYYHAKFSDGRTSVLFNVHDNDEISDETYIYKKIWFEEPTLKPQGGQGEAPQILGWKVEEILNENEFYDIFTEKDSYKLNSPIGPLTDQHILRFWVFIKDPDGDHLYHLEEEDFKFEPELILTNLNDPDNPLNGIKMVWAGKGFHPYPDVDAYFVDLLPYGVYTYDYKVFESIQFRPGSWIFSFTVKDIDENSNNLQARTNIGTKKIWYTGSSRQMWDTMMYGYDGTSELFNEILLNFQLPTQASIVQSIGVFSAYIGAGILTTLGERGRMAGRITATGIAAYDLANTLFGLKNLFSSDDTGALLGLAISSIVSAASLALVYKLSTINSMGIDISKISFTKFKEFNIKNLKIFRNIAAMIFLAQFIYYLYTDPGSLIQCYTFGLLSGNEIDWEALNWNDPKIVELLENYGNLPMEIISLMYSTLALGFILNIAGMKDQDISEYDKELQGFVNLRKANPVIKICKYHVIIKICLATACFLTFMYNTGMFHLAGDYFYHEDLRQAMSNN